MKRIIPFLIIALFFIACKQKQTEVASEEPQLVGPTFSEDSAMNFCAAQCDFGPRTMNSTAHDKCEAWIINKFKEYGCEVTTQKTDITGWDGTTLHSTNIMASINPQATSRVLLCAHWDCRPWADNDPDLEDTHKPILAANDAASGIAVMLEIARDLQNFKKDATGVDSLSSQLSALDSIGIDFVCFDAEDYGTPKWAPQQEEDSWALGAQYFAKHYKEVLTSLTEGEGKGGASWQAAILLDMVGGQGAKFYQEGLSKYYAQSIVDDVWAAASDAGFSSYFPNQDGGSVTDDHKPLNEAGILCIDIIPYYPDCEASAFGPTWHNTDDDMQHLDKNTLKAVGQTLIQYIFTR